jgi:pyrimidine-nucleoside phosphorylase
MLLGAGRDRVEDGVDHAVGAVMLKTRGEWVKEGEALMELHYRDPSRLGTAQELVRRAYVLEDAAPPEQSQVLETVG